MHTKPMADSDGTFAEWHDHPALCSRIIGYDQVENGPTMPMTCKAKVQYRMWESNDGAYEDYQYRCANGHVWWVEGSDA